jgi:hypothetical protein
MRVWLSLLPQMKGHPRILNSLLKQTRSCNENQPKSQAVVVHAFNPSTWEVEAEVGEFLSSRPTWSTK